MKTVFEKDRFPLRSERQLNSIQRNEFRNHYKCCALYNGTTADHQFTVIPAFDMKIDTISIDTIL